MHVLWKILSCFWNFFFLHDKDKLLIRSVGIWWWVRCKDWTVSYFWKIRCTFMQDLSTNFEPWECCNDGSVSLSGVFSTECDFRGKYNFSKCENRFLTADEEEETCCFYLKKYSVVDCWAGGKRKEDDILDGVNIWRFEEFEISLKFLCDWMSPSRSLLRYWLVMDDAEEGYDESCLHVGSFGRSLRSTRSWVV